MLCALWRYFASVAVTAFLAISAFPLNWSVAEDGTNGYTTEDKCDSNNVKGFERRPTSTYQVTTNFLVKPATGTGDSEKNYVEHLHVLAKFASRQLFKISSGYCSFGSGADANLNLIFELFNIRNNVHDECSLNRCVRALSELIESAAINQTDFSRTIDELATQLRRSDSVDFSYPVLAARNALQEAYRHIYSPGTRERVLVDISPNDFANIRFDDFSAWFKEQQTALRNLAHRGQTAVASLPSIGSTQDTPTAKTSAVQMEELSIDHHGWGHRSIILIDHAYEHEGIAGVDNQTLRAICHPNANAAPLDLEPWREMADRLACHREFIGRDKWLCLYSKKEPRATSADMERYGQAIVGLLKSDERIHPGLRVIVVKFMR